MSAKKIDLNLEALRGFAAFVVVWHHIIIHKYWLDPHYIPSGVWAYNAPGHLSVLVFFILSGYVIGASNPVPLEGHGILTYLKKRFVRIYPIYLLSMLFAIVVARQTYSIATVTSNLLLMQTMISATITENNPAWSLNSEVLFYILFVPVSFFRINVLLVFMIALVVGISAYLGFGHIDPTYPLGLAFWLSGVIIAKYFDKKTLPSYTLMVSFLFLLLSLEKFNVLYSIFYKILVKILGEHMALQESMIKLLDLSYLPYCLMMVLVFASIDFKLKKSIIFILMLIPAYTLYFIFKTPTAFREPTLLFPAIFYFIAVTIYIFGRYLENIFRTVVQKLSVSGVISYGLYIIHFPVIALFVRINWFSGTPITFIIRLIIYLLLCIFIAFILEKKFQPWVRNAIN